MSVDLKELAREVAWADGCCGTITRGGKMYACEKPAVAMVRGEFDGDEFYWLGDEFYWPACAWHVNRYGPGVPLVDIVTALREAAS